MKRMDYNIALQCAYLAEDIYQEFSHISFRGWPDTTPTLIEQHSTDTQLAILEDASSQSAVIVFRGTSKGKDWGTNFNMKQMSKFVADSGELVYPEIYGEPSDSVKIHCGFVTAYLSVRARIHSYVNNSSAKHYRIVGHSLGGALAQLCAVDLQYNFALNTGVQARNNIAVVEAYTFGAPKVGNKAFTASYNQRVPRTWRVVNGWDAVSQLPPWHSYHHADRVVKLKRRFTLRMLSTRIADHATTSYIKALAIETKQLSNARSLNRENALSSEPSMPYLAKP